MQLNRSGAIETRVASETTLGFWVNLASRVLGRTVDSELRPLGFALSQLPVLRALAENGALTQKQLAARARVEQPTMAELLRRMEHNGLILRQLNPIDKRETLNTLSRGARARFPKAQAVLMQGERNALSGFSNKERALFLQFLQRVVNNLEDDQASAVADE
jgi:DNA-binding MarR family transcriptional regulator